MINILGELDNLDKEVYNSFPMFMTFCKSLEETNYGVSVVIYNLEQ